MEAEWRLPQSMFAVLLWEQCRTSIQQLWPAESYPACQTLADVKAGISPPRQEAAGRQNRFVITFFNPPADAHGPVRFSKGRFSPTKPSILLKDLFGCSIVDQIKENLLRQGCYQSFQASFSALTWDAFPSSVVELAASRNHQSTFKHFKSRQSQKKKISNCFCFSGTQRVMDGEVEKNSRSGRRNKLQHVP